MGNDSNENKALDFEDEMSEEEFFMILDNCDYDENEEIDMCELH